MTNKGKGTVTPVSKLLPLDEIARAAQHFKDAIGQLKDQQAALKGFSEDNESLRKLVQELPDKVSYNIMVPFGKAAFFPGQLVHTNELMILLGDGYYAEQSAKQAAEILKRRGKLLGSKIEALQTQISDLQARASFANEAAIDAAAGIVEIREEYLEPTTQPPLHEAPAVSDQKKDDEVHERIMATLAQLEAEEAAFEANNKDEEENELYKLNEQATREDDGDSVNLEAGAQCGGPPSFSQELVARDSSGPIKMTTKDAAPIVRSPADLLKFEEWKRKVWERETAEKRKQAKPAGTERRVSFSIPPEEENRIVQEQEPNPIGEKFNREKAFTGSVVERTVEPPSIFVQDAATDESTKRISKFRKNRLGRG